MLTPKDFQKAFTTIIHIKPHRLAMVRSNPCRLGDLNDFYLREVRRGVEEFTGYPESKVITLDESLSQKQWNNLVTISRIILSSGDRFKMDLWHQSSDCGTCHCLAGWAEALEKGDLEFMHPEYEDCNLYPTKEVGFHSLSKWIYPFFWLTQEGSEELLREYLLRPVMAEADREGYFQVSATPTPAPTPTSNLHPDLLCK